MVGPVAFVAPAWLAALAALAVPLALHLWARRPGRVVRVGSLRGLEAAPARARALRLTDPWLLLLRLLLLAALVLALAGPYRAGAGRGRPVTWALVDPALPGDPTARAALAPLLDSLRRTGTPLRLLAPGLPALDATDTTATPAAADAWAVLREADAQLAPGSRIVVLAPDGFTRVSGERPRLRAAVEWRALPGRAAGRSTDAAADRRDTLPLGALLVADAAHAEDARYVGAALRAAAGVSGRAIAVTTAAPDDPAATGAAARPAEWIVWLAARPVPPALRARVRAGARLLTTGDTGLDSTSAGALVPWPGAADAPPLEARVAGAGRWYRFAGRFHPDAGDLVLRPAFAERLATLVLGDSLPARSSTPRPVARTQLLPARDTTSPARATRTAAPPPARAPLATPLWLAALALFALERAVVARRARAA